MITQRAWMVSFVGFCFYLIVLVNTSLPNLYYALTWLAVGILVSSLGVALLSLTGFECHWRIARSHVTEATPEVAEAEQHESHRDRRANETALPGGEALEDAEDATARHDDEGDDEPEHDSAMLGPVIEVQLSNTGSFNKTNILLEVSLQHQRRNETLTRRFLIEALSAGTSLSTGLALRDLPRGRYRVTALRLIGSDVLGLFQVQRRVARQRTESKEIADGATTGLTTGEAEVDEIVVGPAVVTLQGK
ncbi:MAG: hypothetical protein M3347_09650, partial [Armatimonadota bacterium]|nr:hypothetical protein [Armatimonadota bacterium]